MTTAVPTKSQVRKAGERIRDRGAISPDDYGTVFGWRSAHIGALEKAMEQLHGTCRVGGGSILVGRLKRLDSIVGKLCRPGSHHELDRMGDIAGCRLVVDTLGDLDDAVRQIEGSPELSGNKHDYLGEPKRSGYRGVHYEARCNVDDSPGELLVEVQVRDRWQHYWATAVELFDLSTGAGLKAGAASPALERYFALLSDLMAAHDSGKDAGSHMLRELRDMDARLHVFATLREASESVYNACDEPGVFGPVKGGVAGEAKYCLVNLQDDVQTLSVEFYGETERDKALALYSQREESADPGSIHLLARATSMSDLELAYPNYFSNMDELIAWLGNLLRS